MNDFKISEKEKKIWEILKVPTPTLTPQERFQRLMAFRNEWRLYPRKCDATGKNILSAYRPDVPFPVYENEIWWGDSWDALKYAKAFDFSRPFFDQFKELQNVVPREGTSIFNSENCEYNSHTRQSKNCYLNSLIVKCEDVYYSYWMVNDKDTYDSVLTNDSTLCYECIDVNASYDSAFLQECTNCSDCYFSYQLRSCHNCIFSSNLINKEYYIFNKPCTKDEFESMKSKIFDGSYKTLEMAKKSFLDMRKKSIHRNLQTLQSENVVGNHVYRSRNCANAFEVFDSEDVYNTISTGNCKDISSCYSCGWPDGELVYMSVTSRGCREIAFCSYSWFSQNLYYCDSSNSCKDCFGCIGLRHKQYCILNKQYSKEEYEELLPKIIDWMTKTKEWGEFFPANLSVFAYNESAAQEFYPLTKEEALKQGFNWTDYETPLPQVKKLIKASELPDNIKDTPDTILDWAIECEVTGKPFRIVKTELKFYRDHNIPIPHRLPYQRHMDRVALRNKPALYSRNCSKCSQPMHTAFPPEAIETIYCEKCYLETVG
ncbi:MAG: hypothetical protein AAB373_02630 [Patescibacteria group bacterium]